MSSNKPDHEHQRRAEQHAARLGVAGEDRVEVVVEPSGGERGDEADEHRDAADVGCGHRVDPAFVGLDDPTDAAGDTPTSGVKTNVATAATRPIRRYEVVDGMSVGDSSDQLYAGNFAQSAATSARTALMVSGIGAVAQHAGDQLGDQRHLRLLHPLGRDRRRADAHPAGDERAARVVGDRVLVQRDAGLVEHRLGLLAGELGVERAQVDHHQVAVGAAADEPEALVRRAPRPARWR